MNKVKIILPSSVQEIIEKLQVCGFEAYAVGGCVRDSVLGRVPEDWDITTSALPFEVKDIFPRTFDTGIAHGTITVLWDKMGFEITTYRIDGKYEDSRRPKEVLFTRSLEEDLLRRDFTINAMAYNEKNGLIDIFGGLNDLSDRIIRCVGDATARFSEDALRILRGVRFAAQLYFEIEQETQGAMQKLAPTLQNISAERIQIELVKMITSDHPEMLETAYQLGITKEVLPEFDLLMKTEQETPHHMYSVGKHTIQAMINVRADKVLRLVMLLHDMGKPAFKRIDESGVAHFKKHAQESEKIAGAVLRRLKFDNDTVGKVTKLVCYHDYRMPPTAQNVRRAMNKIGKELFSYYLEVRKADILAQSLYLRKEKQAEIEKVEKYYNQILKEEQCVSLKELAVSGKDLIEAGMQPGKEIGEKLEELLQLVLDNPELNTKTELLKQLVDIVR